VNAEQFVAEILWKTCDPLLQLSYSQTSDTIGRSERENIKKIFAVSSIVKR
jgi:hypothetical protein